MAKTLQGILLLCLLLPSAHAHRQHFSWTSIIWDAESTTFNIEHRTHEHDAARLLRGLKKGESDITTMEAQARFALYISDHFNIYAEDVKLEPNLLGAELIGNQLFVYQQLNLTTLPAQLGFETDILMDLFQDQIHIINLEVTNRVQTLKYDRQSQRQYASPTGTEP